MAVATDWSRREDGRLGWSSPHGGVVNMSGEPQHLVLVVDIANVMGSRPDGWWRDRAGAATRLLAELEPLSGAEVTLPEVGAARITEIRAVVEGAAKRVEGPEAVSVLRAHGDGDSEIVEEANRVTAAGKVALVVTADRGLRRLLPDTALIVGPGWLNHHLGR
jgi:nucleotide-binding universal stress UspA family protein